MITRAISIIVIILIFTNLSTTTQLPVKIVYIVRTTSTEKDYTTEIAEYFNLDPRLVKAIIKVESGGNTTACSGKGAKGMMQIMEPTWNWICEDVLSVKWDYNSYCFDTVRNIIVGCSYLRWLYDYWDLNRDSVVCSVDVAVVCSYNAGQGSVYRTRGIVNNLSLETRNYLERVGVGYDK